MRISSGRISGMGSVNSGVSGGGGGMPSSGGLMGIENTIINFLAGLPSWLSTALVILAVVIVAWLAGKILAKLYCFIRYPDPNKPSVLNAKQKVVFLGVVALVVFMLYSTLTKTDDIKDPMTDMPMDDYSDNTTEGNTPSVISPTNDFAIMVG